MSILVHLKTLIEDKEIFWRMTRIIHVQEECFSLKREEFRKMFEQSIDNRLALIRERTIAEAMAYYDKEVS